MELKRALEGYRLGLLADRYSPQTVKIYHCTLDVLAEYVGDIEAYIIYLNPLYFLFCVRFQIFEHSEKLFSKTFRGRAEAN